MKMLGAGLTAISLLAAGLLRAARSMMRVKNLSRLLTVLSLWQNEIGFQAVSLPELVSRYRDEADWLKVCFQKSEEGADFLQAFREAVEGASFEKEEKEALLILGRGFGIGDLEAQVGDIALCRARISAVLKKAEEEKEQQRKLAPMLGMAAGAAVLLICF